MKSYLSLIPISAKIHKKTKPYDNYLYYTFCFLVTAIFSMADMGIRMEKYVRLTITEIGISHLKTYLKIKWNL